MQKSQGDLASIADINELIGFVEQSTETHLTPEERGSLAYDLFNLKESLNQLQNRAEYVKRADRFGKLSLDIWLKAEPLYTETELNREVALRLDRYIEKRKQEFIASKNSQPTEEELAQLGLINARIYFAAEMRRRLSEIEDEILAKCEKLKAQFYHLGDRAKTDLWQKAVAKGLVTDGDKNAMLILPYLVPEMLPEFEEAILNNSTNKKENRI